jgi:site-specific DNA-methyltransferase (adenine-specific)
VLDPFVGSGTTVISCIKQKRNYIGFDINVPYIKAAEKRIKKYVR